MSISSRLWFRCFDSALASATSPFVVSLTRGSLAKSSFKAYIAQDAFYLISFKQAFASAATICRKDLDGFGVDHFETLEVLIEDELKMHAKFALELNIDLTAVRPLPQTLLYTEFLGAVSKTNYVSHICAAMTPCMTLYGWLGRRAEAAGLAQSSNPYCQWINEYSSKGFSENSERLEKLLDFYAQKDKQEYDDLLKLYAKAMELEFNFFNAHETEKWTGIKPGFLGIDFDDTISVGDTISSLCRTGLKAQKRTGDTLYDNLLEQYLSKYQTFMLENLPESGLHSTEYRENDLKLFLETYSKFEDSMLSPVEKAGILKGISASDLTAAAKEILVKPSAIETIKFASYNYPSITPNILSVNWSGMFLGSIMKHQWPENRAVIYGNELQGLHNDAVILDKLEAVSTGTIQRSLTGPAQKGELLRSLLSDRDEQNRVKPSVYIGDSLGDLSALLEADIGVVVGTSSSLRKVCSSFGIELKSLDCLVLSNQGSTGLGTKDKRTLYTADSWAHIGFCLFGTRYVSTWISSWVKDVTLDSPPLSHRSGGSIPRVMSVAGSDSGVSEWLFIICVGFTVNCFLYPHPTLHSLQGGAGIQADIKTCCAFDVFATTAVVRTHHLLGALY
jgi:thiamine phosphate phosphatase / amino-HMP aminohydrolase